MRFNKYTKDELILAVKSSKSIRQVLLTLGVAPHGGNYAVINKYIKKLGLDISHFTGQLWSKGRTIGPKRPLSDYLSNEYSITSHKLRQRLIKERLLEPKCYCCNNTFWNNKPIPLELEHKDGNHHNNELNNLTLLCPNCHAQTSTYRRRKNKSK